MITKGMKTSIKNDWETPKEIYEKLNKEFKFSLDPASNENNHKCKKYYTIKENGLIKSWKNEIVFCNPPYGREIKKWVEKAYKENIENNTEIVMLLPARTDTKWFHEFIYKKSEIRFIKGRLKFGNSKENAPFPSMIVIYKRKEK